MLNTELARLAAIDPLTGLRNRRAIDEYLHDALSAARRHDLALSVLVVDIDHFKTVNDTLGHRSGDAVLAHSARVLDGALRTEDAIGRWGGEEFLVVLSGTDEEGALRATERLREALAQRPARGGPSPRSGRDDHDRRRRVARRGNGRAGQSRGHALCTSERPPGGTTCRSPGR